MRETNLLMYSIVKLVVGSRDKRLRLPLLVLEKGGEAEQDTEGNQSSHKRVVLSAATSLLQHLFIKFLRQHVPTEQVCSYLVITNFRPQDC